MRRIVGRRTVGAFLVGLPILTLLGSPAIAAPPDPPDRLSYQGLLLDDVGAPRTGSVDITLRIFDSLGGGTKIYAQTFASVPLTDGVFSIELGPAGLASDPPTDPLTASLADALAGDIGGVTPDRFLEVSVGTEAALSRTQVLTVPYALRSEEAAHADVADVATTAIDATSVGGLSATFVTELFEHTNFDDSGPPNADPSEGLGDTDADGLANFIDPDNDDDGLSDSFEVAQGSDINLETPSVISVVPSSGLSEFDQDVTVSGSNFTTGMTVLFGTQTPTPTNVTATSFDLQLQSEIPGAALAVQVTRPNGESDTLAGAFVFVPFLSHSIAKDFGYFSFDVAFDDSVAIGGADDQYWANGASRLFPTSDSAQGTAGHLAVAFDPAGNLAGLRCRNTVLDCDVEFAVDSDGDFELDDETGIAFDSPDFNPRIRATSIAFDPAGNPVLGYHSSLLATGFTATVAHDRDGDGAFTGTNELVFVGFAEGIEQEHGEVAVDASSRVAYAYYDGNANAIQVAWDRSGDGDYDDTVGANPEFSSAAVGELTVECLGLGFAPDGDLVIVYKGDAGLTFARDNDADGDFTGAGETVVIEPTSSGSCDVTAGGGNPVAVGYVASDNTVRGLIDRNDDGDFADADEDVVFSLSGAQVSYLRVAHNDAGKVFIATTGSGSVGRFVAADPTP